MSVSELALFSGTPAFAIPLHVGAPNVGDRARLLERIEDILDRRWFTNDGVYGPHARRILAKAGGTAADRHAAQARTPQRFQGAIGLRGQLALRGESVVNIEEQHANTARIEVGERPH